MRSALVAGGNWLFRYRGYVPLPFVLLVFYLDARLPASGTGSGWLRYWDVLCFLISLLGQWMRVQTVAFVPEGTSGRNTTTQLANFLNTTGMYAIVRNPLYTGNFLLGLGGVLYVQNLPLLLVYVVLFGVYYHCIMLAEEDFLTGKFGDTYKDWAARTPRVIPNPLLWTRPAEPFSPRLAIRREGGTLLALLFTFCLLELVQGVASPGAPNRDAKWVVAGMAILAVYALHRYLVNRTDLLRRKPS